MSLDPLEIGSRNFARTGLRGLIKNLKKIFLSFLHPTALLEHRNSIFFICDIKRLTLSVPDSLRNAQFYCHEKAISRSNRDNLPQIPSKQEMSLLQHRKHVLLSTKVELLALKTCYRRSRGRGIIEDCENCQFSSHF